MTKNMAQKVSRKIWMLVVLMLLLFAAEEVVAENLNAPELEKPLAAMKVSLPDAQLNYAVKERDDGRWEWNLFFTQGTSLGVCKVLEESNTIRKVEMYDKAEDTLTADKAMEKLAQEKGNAVIIELELDWDDGRLCYEGEAELEGKRYEFEMTAAGRIIEWERD